MKRGIGHTDSAVLFETPTREIANFCSSTFHNDLRVVHNEMGRWMYLGTCFSDELDMPVEEYERIKSAIAEKHEIAKFLV
jgi:hypothetical protein